MPQQRLAKAAQSNSHVAVPRRADPQRLQLRVRAQRFEGRTLLVEPTPEDAKALRFHLANALGPKVLIVSAPTAAAAVVEFGRHRGGFDLMLINQTLGKAETGIKLLRYLRPRIAYPAEVKAILYADEIAPPLAREALAVGFHHVFHADELGSSTGMIDRLWHVLKPDIDWTSTWRGLP